MYTYLLDANLVIIHNKLSANICFNKEGVI